MILWGLPQEIISDRDPKFISQVWQGMFENLSVKLLFSTAWHPQTDGAAERTNQQVEIAFRYLIATLSNPELWPTIKDKLCAALSSSTSRGTGKAATEVLYGIRIREPADLLAHQLVEFGQESHKTRAASEPATHHNDLQNFPVEHQAVNSYRPSLLEAIDAKKFAAACMKYQYDKRHKPMFFKVGDHVLLRRLELPPAMRNVHPVISIAHLEPATDPRKDPFQRPFAQEMTMEMMPERIIRRRE